MVRRPGSLPPPPPTSCVAYTHTHRALCCTNTRLVYALGMPDYLDLQVVTFYRLAAEHKVFQNRRMATKPSTVH